MWCFGKTRTASEYANCSCMSPRHPARSTRNQESGEPESEPEEVPNQSASPVVDNSPGNSGLAFQRWVFLGASLKQQLEFARLVEKSQVISAHFGGWD